jgi:copper transport protein
MRRLGAWAAALAVPAVVVLSSASPAAGHAYLAASNPADGDRLAQAPHELRLEFSEHVVLSATRVEVRSAQGSFVAVGDVRLEVEDAGDTEEPATIVATLPALAEDAYRVSWETLSSDDLHRTSGLIVFGVGRTVVPAHSATFTVRPEEALLRGGLLAALALTFGGLLALRVLRRSLTGPVAAVARRVVVRLAFLGAVAAPILALLLLLGQVLDAGSGPAALLLGGYGVRWSLRSLGLALLTWTWWRTRRRDVLPVPAAAAGVVLTCLGTSLVGHNGAAGAGLTRALVGATHLAVALTWAGALVCLTAAMLVGRRVRPVPDVLAALRAFGPPAAACLSITAVTGIYLSSETAISIDAALMTTYGRTLLLKVVLVATATGLGLRHHLRLRGPHDLDPPRRSVVLEAGILAAVVSLTGLLASAATATDPSFARSPEPSAVAAGRQVADLQLAVSLSPNRRGDALAVVDVFDTRRPAPGPVIGVDVRLAGGEPVAAERLADGHWSAPVAIGAAGPITITATVVRAGVPAVSADFAWTVPGRHVSRSVVVSQAPLRSALRLVAGGLAVLLLAGWALAATRVRRSRQATAPEPARRGDAVVR